MEHAAAEEERARKEEQLILTHERKVLEMERLERHLEVCDETITYFLLLCLS